MSLRWPGGLPDVPLPDEPEPEQLWSEPARWRVSWRWATKRHECTLAGVLKRCGGRCCKSPSFWPPTSGGREDHGCFWLGPQGCTLSPEDKPVVCHLYPLKVNKSGTLILHRAAALALCLGNHGQGPMILDALRPSLELLFGAEQFERVRADVLAERDSWFDVPPAVLAAAEREEAWAAANTIPRPRSEGAGSEGGEG